MEVEASLRSLDSLPKLARALRGIDTATAVDEPESSALRVAVRVRPPFVNKRRSGKPANGVSVVQVEGNQALHIAGERGGLRKFEFPHVFCQRSSQAHVFRALNLSAIASGALDGYNACLLSFGQTGSGKTHSMLGHWQEVSHSGHWARLLPPVFTYWVVDIVVSFVDPHKTNITRQGIIPRLCGELFHSIGLLAPAERATVRVSAAFFEIYNEQVVELAPRTLVHCYDEVHRVIAAGSKVRTTRATKLNDVSSRSHAIFSLSLRRSSGGVMLDSRVDLVDLAGSERVGQNAEEDLELKEGCHINLSLLTLGRVIHALAERSQRDARDEKRRRRAANAAAAAAAATPRRQEGDEDEDEESGTSTPRRPKPKPKAKERVYVPFRESALTTFLEPTLGGNAKSYMIAHVSPEAPHMQETLSTLRYATECSRIQNRASTNRQSIPQYASQCIATLCDIREQVNETLRRIDQREAERDRLEERIADPREARLLPTLREKLKEKEKELTELRHFVTTDRALFTAVVTKIAACLKEDCSPEVSALLRRVVELARAQAP